MTTETNDNRTPRDRDSQEIGSKPRRKTTLEDADKLFPSYTTAELLARPLPNEPVEWPNGMKTHITPDGEAICVNTGHSGYYYRIDLDRIKSSNDAMDWIFQIHEKGWPNTSAVNEFITCLHRAAGGRSQFIGSGKPIKWSAVNEFITCLHRAAGGRSQFIGSGKPIKWKAIEMHVAPRANKPDEQDEPE